MTLQDDVAILSHFRGVGGFCLDVTCGHLFQFKALFGITQICHGTIKNKSTHEIEQHKLFDSVILRSVPLHNAGTHACRTAL